MTKCNGWADKVTVSVLKHNAHFPWDTVNDAEKLEKWDFGNVVVSSMYTEYKKIYMVGRAPPALFFIAFRS